METNALPFEFDMPTLAKDFLEGSGEVPLSRVALGEFVGSMIGSKIKSKSDLLHVVASFQHGGGLTMLLSFIATENVYFNGIDENRLRLSMFRTAEEAAGRERSKIAAIELGVSSFTNNDAIVFNANKRITQLYGFQEKLLQRVSPTDPGMRK